MLLTFDGLVFVVIVAARMFSEPPKISVIHHRIESWCMPPLHPRPDAVHCSNFSALPRLSLWRSYDERINVRVSKLCVARFVRLVPESAVPNASPYSSSRTWRRYPRTISTLPRQRQGWGRQMIAWEMAKESWGEVLWGLAVAALKCLGVATKEAEAN